MPETKTNDRVGTEASKAGRPAKKSKQQPSASDETTAVPRWKERVLHPRSLVVVLLLTLIGSLAFQEWTDPERHFQTGMQGVRENDPAKIERAVAALEDVSTYQAQHAFLQASLHLRDGQPQRALRLALSSQNHPDVEVESRILAGEAAYQLGAAGNAQMFWEDALARDPQSVEAHQWLGVLYFDLGAMDNAIFHLQTVSRLSPEDPRPDRLMGLINLDYERPEVAIPHYEETLRRAPDQPGVEKVWLELAECQIKQREYEAAMNSLRHCDDSPQKKRLTAQCQMNLGSLEEAKRLAQEALEAEPENLASLQLNADIALVDGEVERAAELLRKGTEVDPFDHGARTQLAQVLGRLGLEEESAKHSQRAEELQELWQRFSDLQIDAINERTNAQIRYEIGQLASQLGRPELANSWYKAALAIDPNMTAASNALQEQSKP